MFQHLTFDVQDHVARIVLHRPPVNALNKEFVAELAAVPRLVARSRDIWLVTLTSSLEVFSAGADLKERAAMPEARVAGHVKAIQRMVRSWLSIPQPVVAGMRGAALGGGLELALAADLIVVAREAQLGFPEVSLGIIPAAGGTQLLIRRTTPAIATKWILSGSRFSGEEAYAGGVVDYVFPRDAFDRGFAEVLSSLQQNAPLALRQAKRAMRQSLHRGMGAGFDGESAAYQRLIRTNDRREALRAFLEKRPPHWQGK
jgi:methylglutaconyl-CoA hydratase